MRRTHFESCNYCLKWKAAKYASNSWLLVKCFVSLHPGNKLESRINRSSCVVAVTRRRLTARQSCIYSIACPPLTNTHVCVTDMT